MVRCWPALLVTCLHDAFCLSVSSRNFRMKRLYSSLIGNSMGTEPLWSVPGMPRHAWHMVCQFWAKRNATRPASASHAQRPATCASAASVSGSQKVISIAWYSLRAAEHLTCACSRGPVMADSVPRPRWQWAMRGRLPSAPARARAWSYWRLPGRCPVECDTGQPRRGGAWHGPGWYVPCAPRRHVLSRHACSGHPCQGPSELTPSTPLGAHHRGVPLQAIPQITPARQCAGTTTRRVWAPLRRTDRTASRPARRSRPDQRRGTKGELRRAGGSGSAVPLAA